MAAASAKKNNSTVRENAANPPKFMYETLENAQDLDHVIDFFKRGFALESPETPNFIFLVGSPAAGKTTQAARILESSKEDINNYYTVSLDLLIERVKPYHNATWRTYDSLEDKTNIEEHMGKFSGRYTTVMSSQRNNFGMTKNMYEKEKNYEKAYPIKKDKKKLLQIFDEAIIYGVEQGYNILYDTTLDPGKDKIMKILDILVKHAPKKYKIRVLLVNEDEDTVRRQLAQRHQEMIASKGDRAIRGISYKMIPIFIRNNRIAFSEAKDYYKPDSERKGILGDYTSDDFEFEVIGKPLSARRAKASPNTGTNESPAGSNEGPKKTVSKSAKGGARKTRRRARTRRQRKTL